jgi:hypothetical protein
VHLDQGAQATQKPRLRTRRYFAVPFYSGQLSRW